MITILLSLSSGVIGAIIAAIITVQLTAKSQKQQMKKQVAEELFGYRYQLVREDSSMDEILFCLNKIPIVFNRNERIINIWNELYFALSNKTDERDELLALLIKEVCVDVGISSADRSIEDFKKVIS
ncbi:MAG: hypothetical protein IJA01_02495 [Firmicutes bacterium]|nr:hypothetical protein [Bacillota bacterium]